MRVAINYAGERMEIENRSQQGDHYRSGSHAIADGGHRPAHPLDRSGILFGESMRVPLVSTHLGPIALLVSILLSACSPSAKAPDMTRAVRDSLNRAGSNRRLG